MSGIPPRIAISFDKRQHLRSQQWNRHDAVPFLAGENKTLLRRKRGNPEWRTRQLGRARKRSRRRKAVEAPVVTHVLIFEKTPDRLDSFFEPRAAFVERHTKAAEL